VPWSPALLKALARRWYEEIWNQGRLEVADEIFAAAYVHPGQPVPGPAGVKAHVERYRRAFPDIHFTIEDLLAEGDRVVARLTFRGTHLGPLDGVAATGRRVEVRAIGIFQAQDGRFIRHWGVFDALALRWQLAGPRR
jgi:steroid delta-isomerase-like uncharacterized protein